MLEFYNHTFDDFYNMKDIMRHHTCIGTPQYNGIV